MFNNPAKPEWLAKQFRANELGKNYMLSTGKMNPWDLPEFESMKSTMTKERDLGLSEYARNLTRTGVEGPGAALGMERYGNQFSNRLLDFVNQIMGGASSKGLNVGNSILDQGMKEKQFGLQARAAHEQRKQQPNDWTKWNKGINEGIGTATNLVNFGVGGAALGGFKVPGLQDMPTSSIAGMGGMGGSQSGLNGMNFMQLLQMLMKMQGG